MIGILRVLEEILEKRPDAHIVLNSLFPMTTLRGNAYPILSDVEDSFVTRKDRKKTTKKYKGLQKSNRFLSSQNDNSNARTSNMTEFSAFAELEEMKRDKKERTNILWRWMKKRSPVVLSDATEIRKYKIGHLRQTRLPLWGSVKAINLQLKEFAAKHSDHVSYFDATDIFIKRDGSNKNVVLRADMSSPKGHPTIEGFRRLETKMIQFLADLEPKITTSNEQKQQILPIRIGPSNGTIDNEYLNRIESQREESGSGGDDLFTVSDNMPMGDKANAVFNDDAQYDDKQNDDVSPDNYDDRF